jgi:hypothetical protein
VEAKSSANEREVEDERVIISGCGWKVERFWKRRKVGVSVDRRCSGKSRIKKKRTAPTMIVVWFSF